MYAELVEANNLVLFRQAMNRHVSMPENEIALLFSTLKGV